MFAPPQWLQDLGLLAWIAGGCLFGMVGLVLAAPIAAAVHISRDLAVARSRAAAEPEPTGDAPPVPASAG